MISRIDEERPPGVSICKQDGGRRVVVRVLDRAAKVVGDERVDDAVETQADDRGCALRQSRSGEDDPERDEQGENDQAGGRFRSIGTSAVARLNTRMACRVWRVHVIQPTPCPTNRAGMGSGADNRAAGGSQATRNPRSVYRREPRVQARNDGPLLPREEQQLVEGLLAGDDVAVRAIYARFGRPVYTLGLRLLGTREAAEELTQDVFLTAWRKAARFDASRGRLSTWLMTIAHNLAVDRLRRETGVTRPTLVLVDEVPEQAGLDEGAVVLERDAALRALESLSDAERRLLARAYFRGLTAREIAEADGIPLGTVKTRLRAALIKVRRANEGKEQS